MQSDDGRVPARELVVCGQTRRLVTLTFVRYVGYRDRAARPRQDRYERREGLEHAESSERAVRSLMGPERAVTARQRVANRGSG
jgi:hypothetical protein